MAMHLIQYPICTRKCTIVGGFNFLTTSSYYYYFFVLIFVEYVSLFGVTFEATVSKREFGFPDASYFDKQYRKTFIDINECWWDGQF